MQWDADYSWMDNPTIKAPLPYSVRRRRSLYLSLCMIALAVGVLMALAEKYAGGV